MYVGYWPTSVHVVGHFHSICADNSAPSALSTMQVELETFLDQCAKAGMRRPVYFGFGSMKPWERPESSAEPFGHSNASKRAKLSEAGKLEDAPNSHDLARSPSWLYETLSTTLKLLGLPGIFHNIPGPGHGQAQELKTSLPISNQKSPVIFELTGFVDLAWLFPRCSLVVHHGGAGTVTQAALAQVPQVVCPIEFDQQFWADRVEALGMGVSSQLHSTACFASSVESDVASSVPLASVELRTAVSRSLACAPFLEEVASELGLAASVRILADLLKNQNFYHAKHR